MVFWWADRLSWVANGNLRFRDCDLLLPIVTRLAPRQLHFPRYFAAQKFEFGIHFGELRLG
jgi:hypothetical protein